MTRNNVIDAASHKAAPQKQKSKRRAEEGNPALVDRFVIRLPDGLRDQIKALSEQNHRSMNAEIIMVLEKHIRQKFLQQMQEANPSALGEDTAADGSQPGVEDELSRRLEALPPGKKEALLELLG